MIHLVVETIILTFCAQTQSPAPSDGASQDAERMRLELRGCPKDWTRRHYIYVMTSLCLFYCSYHIPMGRPFHAETDEPLAGMFRSFHCCLDCHEAVVRATSR
jgi:hypothetical protein